MARLFSRYATLLEIDGANAFRVRAYRNAARLIEGLARGVADMVRDRENLTELEGIGADLAAKIEGIVRSGRLEACAQPWIAAVSSRSMHNRSAATLQDGEGLRRQGRDLHGRPLDGAARPHAPRRVPSAPRLARPGRRGQQGSLVALRKLLKRA